MIAGALAISFAEAPADEQREWRIAMERECERYGLDRERVAAALTGSDPSGATRRRWWEMLIVAAAVAMFVWLGVHAQRPAFAVDMPWLLALTAASLVLLVGGGLMLWKRTRFS
jgi:ferric-dicitrate binding protein FerR (iron transport regulator)